MKLANYCVVFGNLSNAEKIRRWFSLNNDTADDLFEIKISEGSSCHYLAKQGRQDATADGGVFKGYAIDHSREEIIFSGHAQSPNVHWPLSGCYLKIQRDFDDIIVGNDLFAQLPMIYFAENGVVAISDSVFVLSQLRRHMGISNHVNIDAALSRAWIHGMASQPLGTSTLIDGVNYCPPGSKIRIKSVNKTLNTIIEKVHVADIFLNTETDYKGTILKSANRIASVIATLAQNDNTNTILSLSGGIDSRICLAAALAGRNNKTYYSTAKVNKSDFIVAQALGERFNFDFKIPENKVAIPKDQISSWFLSCAGIYDPLKVAGGVPQKINFTITGLGAEACKGNFGWRPLSAIAPANVGHVSSIRPLIEDIESGKHKGASRFAERCRRLYFSGIKRRFKKLPKVQEDISLAAYREASQGLLSVGIAPEDPWATEWHYLCFRNAIHSGRTTMTSLLAVSPLLQRELVGLSRSSSNAYPAPREGAPSIISDLLIALHPELALMSFDDPKKNMQPAYVGERSRFLGQIGEIKPYAFVGDPYAVNSGTPKMFFNLIECADFKGRLNPSAVKKLVSHGYESIPRDIRHAYDMPNSLVQNFMPESCVESSWICITAGKIMSFLLTDQ